MRGQAMLLAVTLIGSVVLIFSSISGYFILQRLRMAADFVDSSKAIYAADTGLEWKLYQCFKCGQGGQTFCDINPVTGNCSSNQAVDNLAPSMEDSLTSFISNVAINVVGASTTYDFKSVGTSNKSHRAFELILEE